MIGNNEILNYLLVKEDFLPEPTDIGDGKLTIGSGLTDSKWLDLYRKRGNKWSKEDNRKAVLEEIQKRRLWAEQNVPHWNSLPEASQDALLSYRYNYNFTPKNSPKLFKALEDKNYSEAARQMDATSKNPDFKNGLLKRRKEEQQWFLSGFPELSKSNDFAIPYKYPVPEYPTAAEAYRKSMAPITGNYSQGGQLQNHKQWKDLSYSEKNDIIKVAVRNGITTLPEIRQKYNEFADGGNLYAGGGYVYDMLPQLFASDGVQVRVTSGYRPNSKVQGSGKPSRHSMHEAADIVGDFSAIRRVLDNPESNTAKWMRANGYGYLDETSKTGTKKFWHDQKGDHSHYHIGKDSGIAKKFATSTGITSNAIPIVSSGNYLDIAKAHIRNNEGWSPLPVADGPKNTGWRSIGYGFNDSGFRAKYPQGISKAYENGITKAQAEQELDYILGNMDSHLRKVYGSKWNSFNDNQKAAILDTYYQRPASVVGRNSAFYNAVMRGDNNAVNYLGVAGYNTRNNDRRKLFSSTVTQMPEAAQTVQQPLFYQSWNPQAANLYTPYSPLAPYPAPIFSPEEQEEYFAKQIAQAQKQQEAEQSEKQRQEKADRINRFSLLMNLTDPYNSDSSSNSSTPFADAVNMLTQRSPVYYFSNGGSIHIKPENRGKFTRLKERTGHSASWFKENGTPAQKKMATFALNARHFKHGLGGNLFGMGRGNPFTVGATVNSLYAFSPKEEFLGEPDHHYDFTQSEEWANAHGYYPDERGHRDDRVKKPAHPSHPSRGTWNGNTFMLSDLGMQNPNYTLFGLNDGGQDPQATLTYKGGVVLPEITVTPKENYIFNPYDNIILHQKALGGNLFDGGGDTKADIPVTFFTQSEAMPLLADNPNRTAVLDEVTVKPYKKLPMQSELFQGITNQAANEKADEYVNRVTPTAEDLLNIGTLGGLNNLSPTQWARRAYDLRKAIKGNMSWDKFGNSWFYGNNGLVSDKYAQEHPYTSAAINLIGDIGAVSTFSALRKLPKYTTRMEAENRAAQEAAALNWRDMFSNSVRPSSTYRRVSTESPTTIGWAESTRAPQITAENATNYPSIMADAEDFSLKGGSDLFTRRLYNMKIHGQDLKDFSGKTFSSDVKKGISNKTKEEIRNNVVRRNMREFMNDGLTSSEVAPYATKVEELMNDINVGRYSQRDYEKAGWGGFGGFYDPERNFISINTEAAEKGLSVEPHEVRHAIDHNIDDEILTPTSEIFDKDFDSDRVLSSMQRTRQKQNMILQDAYDNDFIDIPNKPGYNEGFENYPSLEREAITTNRDAREALLGSKKDWEPDTTDKIIDKMPDAAIFEAVEKANGYGKRFIKFLRENNKLTPKKAQQFREAMKHVGAYAAPVGVTVGTSAATLYNKSK